MNKQTLEYGALSGKRIGISGFGTEESSAIRETIESTEAFCRVMQPGIDEAALLSFDVVVIKIDDEATRSLLEQRSTPQHPALLMIGTTQTVAGAMPLLKKTAGDFLLTGKWSSEDLLMRTLHLSWKVGHVEPHSHAGVQAKVLIVDDDNAVISLLSNVLKKAGFECHAARDGTAALDMARQIHPDLMIIDVNLPDRDGFEVLKTLHQTPDTASIKTMLLTGREQEADVLRGFGLGADDYVTKPFNPMEVSARIKSLLGRAQ